MGRVAHEEPLDRGDFISLKQIRRWEGFDEAYDDRRVYNLNNYLFILVSNLIAIVMESWHLIDQ